MTLVKGNRQLLILVIILGIFSLGTFNILFVLWKSQDFGITDNDISLVYAECDSYYNRIPIGVLEDKIGKEKVLTFGLSIFVLSLMLMVLFFRFKSISFSLCHRCNIWIIYWNNRNGSEGKNIT